MSYFIVTPEKIYNNIRFCNVLCDLIFPYVALMVQASLKLSNQ